MTRRIVFLLLGGVVLMVGCKQPAVSHAPYAPPQPPCAGPACGNGPLAMGQAPQTPASGSRFAWGAPSASPPTTPQGLQLPAQWNSAASTPLAMQPGQFPQHPALPMQPGVQLGQPRPGSIRSTGPVNSGGIVVAAAPVGSMPHAVPAYSPSTSAAEEVSQRTEPLALPGSVPAYQPYGK